MGMDLNELMVFATVAETRSFTAAGVALDLPKSTVSRKVAQLEERLGVQLLQRTTRKLGLTDVGTVYYQRCAQIIADIASAERDVTDLQATPQGTLRISAPVDIAATFLGDIIAEFSKCYPEISVELDATDGFADLIEDGVDLAIRVGPLAISSLMARRLAVIHTILVAAPGYLDTNGEPNSTDDLIRHQMVLFTPGSRRTSWTLQGPGGATMDFRPPAKISSSSLLAVRDAAIAGGGIAVLPDSFAHAAIAAGRLRQVLPSWAGAPRELYAVFAGARNQSPRLRALLDHLIAAFEPPPWQR